MKIVFCTQNMAPFRMKWMDEIAKYCEVVVYHLNEYDSDQNLKYISYFPTRASVNCNTRNLLGNKGYCIKKILAEKPDIYILDGYGFPGQWELILRLRLLGIKFLISADGGFIKYNEKWYKKAIKTFFLSKADGYLSTSEQTDKFINYYGGVGKTKYRHYFSNVMNDYVEVEPLHVSERTILKKELGMKDTFSVIAVGKAQYVKGFDLLIQALEKVNNNIDVYFIGISDARMYESFISDKTRNRIHFIDFCDSAKLKQYYRASDLFVLPTRGDVWGLVISEAMANGMNIITTNKCLAGVAMLDKDFIIESESIVQLVDAIERCYNMSENERWNLGMNNIEKMRPYTIENSTVVDMKHFNDYLWKRSGSTV